MDQMWIKLQTTSETNIVLFYQIWYALALVHIGLLSHILHENGQLHI